MEQWALEENPSACQGVRVFLVILRALMDIHAQGVLQRDLKGDNILWDAGRMRTVSLGNVTFP
jgi:serine/threonine-protein kinase